MITHEMVLVDSDDAIGPHILLIDNEDGEKLPLTFNKTELKDLRNWCNRQLKRVQS